MAQCIVNVAFTPRAHGLGYGVSNGSACVIIIITLGGGGMMARHGFITFDRANKEAPLLYVPGTGVAFCIGAAIAGEPAPAAALFARLAPFVPRALGARRAAGCNPHIRLYEYAPGQRFGAHYDESARVGEANLRKSQFSEKTGRTN